MRLKLLLPNEVLLDTTAAKVVVDGADGRFCLLPRHADFVAALEPGILAWTGDDGEERLLATDTGTLVKCGDDVMVSVLNAIEGADLDSLRDAVETRFHDLDEHERAARSALARLEAGTLRRFIELERGRHGG